MGSRIGVPRFMIGADEGGGVGIKGTLPQRQLARTLRRLREEAGLTLEEVAPKLDWSTSKLGRIETAENGVDVHGVRSMLGCSGSDG
jgi:Helix-turn-helix domain